MALRHSCNAEGARLLPEWAEKRACWKSLETSEEGGVHVAWSRTGKQGLACARVGVTRDMEPSVLEGCAARAYEGILGRLEGMEARHPVRFWNFIPDIHRQTGDGRDRYMVFNAGRFAAFERYYAGRQAFDGRMATASAVGHDGADLLILCLSHAMPGEPVDNPRQIKAYCYSPRFGPRPPCFARGMVIEDGGRRLLLAGGTASIVGEESAHAGDVKRQFDETLENLAALVRRAEGSDQSLHGRADALNRYRELRVYHPRKEDGSVLRQWLASAMVNVRRVELMQAELCRAELLVEIEGVAELQNNAAGDMRNAE